MNETIRYIDSLHDQLVATIRTKGLPTSLRQSLEAHKGKIIRTPSKAPSGYLIVLPFHFFQGFCCCQIIWQKWTNQISRFLFRTSINLFRSWRTIIRNKLIHISLFFMNVRQLRNKFMLMWNKNILIWFVHFCQTRYLTTPKLIL